MSTTSPSEIRAGIRPGAIWSVWILCAAVLYVYYRASIIGPFVFFDEATYFSLSKAIYFDHNFARHVQYNPLYPLLLAPLFAMPSATMIYEVVRILNALIWSSAVFPVYFVSRRLTANTWLPWLIAVAAVFMPSSLYISVVMAEALFYPLCAWTIYLAVKTLDTPSTRTAVIVGVFAGLLFLTKQVGLLAAVSVAACFIVHYIRNGRPAVWRSTIIGFGVTFVVMSAPWIIRNLLTPGGGVLGYTSEAANLKSAVVLAKLVEGFTCNISYLLISLTFIGFIYFVLALVEIPKASNDTASILILIGIFSALELAFCSLITAYEALSYKTEVFDPFGRYLSVTVPWLLCAAAWAASSKRDPLATLWRFAVPACCLFAAALYVSSPLRAVIARNLIDDPGLAPGYGFFGGVLVWGDAPRAVTEGQRILLVLCMPCVVGLSVLLLRKPVQRIAFVSVMVIASGFLSGYEVRVLPAATVAANRMAAYLIGHGLESDHVEFDSGLNPLVSPFPFWFKKGLFKFQSVMTEPASRFRNDACFDFGTMESSPAPGCVPIRAPWSAASLFSERHQFGFEARRLDSLLSYFQPQRDAANGLEDFIYGADDTKFFVSVSAERSFLIDLRICLTDRGFDKPVNFTINVDGAERKVDKASYCGEGLEFRNVKTTNGLVTVEFVPKNGSVWLINLMNIRSQGNYALPPGIDYYVTDQVLPLPRTVGFGDLNLYKISELPSPVQGSLSTSEPISAELQDRPLKEFAQTLWSSAQVLHLSLNQNTVVPVAVRNSGSEVWHRGGKYPIHLAYVWLEEGKIVQEGARVTLPQELSPGETVNVSIPVAVPAKGSHLTLRLSMVQEAVSWFFTAGANPLDIPVVMK
jgi:hypothetical protein